jgi:hypothetical protein
MAQIYRDPSTERLSDGRSIADLMPGRTRGIQGVIVGPSTKGGVPINYNPHDLSNLEVTVEPDGPGKTVLRFGHYSKEEIADANATAAEKYPGQDIESHRERALYALQLLARAPQTKVATEEPPRKTRFSRKTDAAPVASNNDEDDEETIMHELEEEVRAPMTPPIEKIDRGYSPMAAFGLKKKSGAGNPPTAAPINSQIGPPKKLVYFEKEGIGTVPAFFHDIITAVSYTDDVSLEESGFMVLIYDTRFEQSAARWFPPSNDPYNRPWAVQVADERKLYLVHTTGFQYVYDNREYCILLVEKAVVVQE